MIKKITLFLWSIRFQFAKYFIIGISSFILDLGSLIIFKEIFGLSPVISVVINQVFLLIYVFLMNKYWSFKNVSIPHKQILRFLTLTFCNYLLSILFMYIFNHKYFNFDYRLVRTATIALMVSWNFFLYKYWVYKTEDAVLLVEEEL